MTSEIITSMGVLRSTLDFYMDEEEEVWDQPIEDLSD